MDVITYYNNSKWKGSEMTNENAKKYQGIYIIAWVQILLF